ncbi:zinc finger and BTB domain-containing protein 2 [Sarotherodon galilaeus]
MELPARAAVEEPPRWLDAPAAPCARTGPPYTHPPTTPATHQPGPRPLRPGQGPSPETERPQNLTPIPDPPRGSQATRSVTHVRQHRPSPSPAARSHEETVTQEPTEPLIGHDRYPGLSPPRKMLLGNPPMP